MSEETTAEDSVEEEAAPEAPSYDDGYIAGWNAATAVAKSGGLLVPMRDEAAAAAQAEEQAEARDEARARRMALIGAQIKG